MSRQRTGTLPRRFQEVLDAEIPLILAAFMAITFGTGNRCNEMSSPGVQAAMPVVTHIDDNPTRPGSVLIVAGREFDATTTFTLQQGGAVKTTLINPIFAAGTRSSGIQIDVTIPLETTAGTYQGCVTTPGGTACGAAAVGVLP